MNQSQLTEALQPEMQSAITELIAQNVSAIATELQDSPEGKLKVSCGLSLTLIGTKLYTTGTLSYSRKFSDEVESVCDVDDETNPRLPGIAEGTVTIKTGNHSVTLGREQLAEAKERINKHVRKTAGK